MRREQLALAFGPAKAFYGSEVMWPSPTVQREFDKAMRTALEERIGQRVPNDSDIVKWLIKYAAFNKGRRDRGKDGKTSFARVNGIDYTSMLFEPGEAEIGRAHV